MNSGTGHASAAKGADEEVVTFARRRWWSRTATRNQELRLAPKPEPQLPMKLKAKAKSTSEIVGHRGIVERTSSHAPAQKPATRSRG